jgi:hypothetical protein
MTALRAKRIKPHYRGLDVGEIPHIPWRLGTLVFMRKATIRAATIGSH